MTVEIVQVTDGRGRRYEIHENGEKVTVPSVTTLLGAMPKPGLDWHGFKLGLKAAQLLDHEIGETQGLHGMDFDGLYELAKKTDHAPHRFLKAAGARGTDVHNVAEALLKTGKLECLPAGTRADEGYIDALVKWHTDLDVDSWEMLAIEELLFSQMHRYAGQTDFIAKKPDGTYVIGDFKTSRDLHLSHHLQAAAYEQAAREMGLVPEGAKVERHVIRLGVDGEYEVQSHPTVTVEDFLAVAHLHNVIKTKDKKAVRL